MEYQEQSEDWRRVYRLEEFPEDALCMACQHGIAREARLTVTHPTVLQHMRECGIDPKDVAPRLRTIYCKAEHQVIWWSPLSWDESTQPGIVEKCQGYELREEEASGKSSDIRTAPRVQFGRGR